MKKHNVPISGSIKIGLLCDSGGKERREEGCQSTGTKDPCSRKTEQPNDRKAKARREEGRQSRYVNNS